MCARIKGIENIYLIEKQLQSTTCLIPKVPMLITFPLIVLVFILGWPIAMNVSPKPILSFLRPNLASLFLAEKLRLTQLSSMNSPENSKNLKPEHQTQVPIQVLMNLPSNFS